MVVMPRTTCGPTPGSTDCPRVDSGKFPGRRGYFASAIPANAAAIPAKRDFRQADSRPLTGMVAAYNS